MEVSLFVWIVPVLEVVRVLLVLPVQRVIELRSSLVLLIHGRWHQSILVSWSDLRLLLSVLVVVGLLVWVVEVLSIGWVFLVLAVQRLVELGSSLILLINWRCDKTCWFEGSNLSLLLSVLMVVRNLVWVVVVLDVI